MKKPLAAIAAAAIALPVIATAQDVEDAVAARQGQFKIMALNLGILGGMARGQVDYDAEAAQTAADNLVAISMLSQGAFWPAGSDTFSVEGTRAMPAIWDNLDDVLSKWDAYGEAATALQAVASDGQGALGPALGQLGGTCKACHDAYREPQ
jgi:cytochrome c556